MEFGIYGKLNLVWYLWQNAAGYSRFMIIIINLK